MSFDCLPAECDIKPTTSKLRERIRLLNSEEEQNLLYQTKQLFEKFSTKFDGNKNKNVNNLFLEFPILSQKMEREGSRGINPGNSVCRLKHGIPGLDPVKSRPGSLPLRILVYTN